MDVYINDIAAFLPNDPVTNDEMETVLGAVHNIPSRIKNRILKTTASKNAITPLTVKPANSTIPMPC